MAYEKSFNNPYPDGWKNLPSTETPVTAEALQSYSNVIETIEDFLDGHDFDGGGGGGGTTDYSQLNNKPQINGVELDGNKTTSDLGISYNDLTNKPTIPTDGTQLSYYDSLMQQTMTVSESLNQLHGMYVTVNHIAQENDQLIRGGIPMDKYIDDLKDSSSLIDAVNTTYNLAKQGGGGGTGGTNAWSGSMEKYEEEKANIPNGTMVMIDNDDAFVPEDYLQTYSTTPVTVGKWLDGRDVKMVCYRWNGTFSGTSAIVCPFTKADYNIGFFLECRFVDCVRGTSANVNIYATNNDGTGDLKIRSIESLTSDGTCTFIIFKYVEDNRLEIEGE